MTVEDLLNKVENFGKLSQSMQVMLTSYFLCVANNKTEFNAADIKKTFEVENLKLPSNLHREISNLLSGRNPAFVQKGNDYTLHRDKWRELNELYLDSKHSREISTTLRNLIPKLNSQEQKAFLDEAIICFEVKCYRASIILTWLLTMDILYEFVLNRGLSNFQNSVQAHGQYKKISFQKKEDFSEIKESSFLELLRVGKDISGDEFKILKEKLDFRNTAAHPNSIIIKESKAVSFIEDLVDNIITKFQ